MSQRRGYAHNDNGVLACVAERLKELTEGLRGLPGLPGPARHGRPGRAGKRGIPGTYRSERSNSLKRLEIGLFKLMDAFVVRMQKIRLAEQFH